jgi:hypothetical protein
MSALLVCKTEMKNLPTILEALVLAGVPKDVTEQASGTTQKDLLDFKGYGSQRAKAQVVVRKSWHGGYGDFGFLKDAGSDNYNFLVDDLDDRGALLRKTRKETEKHNSFSGRLNQWYAAAATKRALKNQGFSTSVKEDGGKIRVMATAY